MDICIVRLLRNKEDTLNRVGHACLATGKKKKNLPNCCSLGSALNYVQKRDFLHTRDTYLGIVYSKNDSRKNSLKKP
jgi:hypothetical protein